MSGGEQWITHFGRDQRGWNNRGEPEDDDSGMPGIILFSNAVQVWAAAQGRAVTIDEAALAFNVAPALMREAVEAHYWMDVAPDGTIRHEGE